VPADVKLTEADVLPTSGTGTGLRSPSVADHEVAARLECGDLTSGAGIAGSASGPVYGAAPKHRLGDGGSA
jgi:hypothetical protein